MAATPMWVVPDVVDDPRRVAVLSVHTSPLDQPGTRRRRRHERLRRRAGRRLADRGVEVDIFTRATSQRPAAGGRAGARRAPCDTSRPGRSRACPRRTCPASCAPSPPACCGPRRARPEGWYDLVHSHYWLSGQVGWLASRAVERAARPRDAHDGQGQEPRARRGRRPRAGRPGHRRAAGRRRRRPARRQHRRARPTSSSSSTTPTRPGSRSCAPASTSTCSPPATGARRARARSASPPTRSCCCSSGGSSR